MPGSSQKYICPGCYRSARATRKDVVLICGYCEIVMKRVFPYNSAAASQDDSDEEVDADVQK